LKVTLIQPKYFNIWEALGLAYVGAYLKKKYNGQLEINFFQGYFDDDKTIIEGSIDSDIIGVSCTSPVFRATVNLTKEIKKHNRKAHVVVGGFHPSAVPDDCLKAVSIDQVVTGEGEGAFLDILNGNRELIVKGKPFLDFNSIFPDRELIKNDRTITLCKQLTGARITSFLSIRGCPFSCAFCAERIVTGVHDKKANPLRVRDPKHLLDEIEEVTKKYDLEYFKFSDATWNTSTQKVVSFCEEKIRRNIKTPWEANVHASFVSKEMLKIMKEAGCHQINVGCESGSQKILKDIRKGLTINKIIEVFRLAEELGIERRAFFLLGMPNETVNDINETEKLVDTIRPDVFGVTLLCPYPGTDFYNQKTMKDLDWTFADEYSNSFWKTEHFSNNELKDWQGYLTKKYSKNLSWHNKIIKEACGCGHDESN